MDEQQINNEYPKTRNVERDTKSHLYVVDPDFLYSEKESKMSDIQEEINNESEVEEKTIKESIVEFTEKHPIATLGIILGGFTLIYSRLLSSSISRGVYKGYMKSLRNLYKVVR